MSIHFLDLFAGAGGLSEGFIQAGFTPVAHVEMDKAACFTLKTRASFHYLDKTAEGQAVYKAYLNGAVSRPELYAKVPSYILDSVIEETIGENTIDSIFARIDNKLSGRKIDIIVGGPPCQAYSLVGRARVGERIKEDTRNELYKFYVDFLKRYQPKYFVFENVVGLRSAVNRDGEQILPLINHALEGAGYDLDVQLFEAEKYGVPQKRRRHIIIGRRSSSCYPFPVAISTPCALTVNEVLGDLKHIGAGEGTIRGNGRAKGKKPNLDLIKMGISDRSYPVTYQQSRPHNSRDLEIYRIAVELWNSHKERLNYAKLPERLKSHKNQVCFLDRYKVVEGNALAAHTIVAHICKDGHYYIHPDITQNRSLTPREAARLQTFPDNFYFESLTPESSRLHAYKQIGNAVPVRLAYVIACAIKESFKRFTNDL